MSVSLRIVLIIASILTLLYMLRKIQKSQLKIDDSIFWMFFSAGLLILSIFPDIAVFFSQILGIQSASNFIFLAIIFVLLLKLFLMTVKISKLENKLQTLVQRLAVSERTKAICEYNEDSAEDPAVKADIPTGISM